ncbi:MULTISPECIES: RNA polymerase sigma factor SigZ [unclassified Marinomonas]|uniref:RNA polymerase sigma factor SigZ n=1 Tax=unclassified Marinomonas TaxID=196814 RepID=UPI0007AF5A01|nr:MULTISPECIES: RNA polymerase sigma factor SigZ [unclassified Marinomonas]
MTARPQLDQIWQEYRQALKAFLHTKVSCPDDVDDLLQEVLLKSFTKLDGLKDAASIKAWLFQIANHSVIDFYRKNAKKVDQIEGEEGHVAEEGKSDTFDNTIKAELSHCVQPFISALPYEQAELLQAIELEGISQKAYAEQRGIPYSTLKSQVKKARLELKALFDQCCHFQEDKLGNLIEYERKQNSNLDMKKSGSKGSCDPC